MDGEQLYLLWASGHGLHEVIQLLHPQEESINKQLFNSNITPFHLAVFMGHKNVVDILLQHGASMTTDDRMYHDTVHHMAISAQPMAFTISLESLNSSMVSSREYQFLDAWIQL